MLKAWVDLIVLGEVEINRMEQAMEEQNISQKSDNNNYGRFNFWRTHGVLVTEKTSEYALISYYQELNSMILLELRRLLQLPIKLKKVSKEMFEELMTQQYETNTDAAATAQIAEDIGDELDLSQLMDDLPKTEDLLDGNDDAPIIRLLNALLSEAIKQSASDLHFETYENSLTVRFRIDGVLREIITPQRVLAPLLVSRIKVMARLDIAEKRLPQDGRITLRIAGRPVDVRVSTMPAAHGERVVLRLLDKKAAHLDLGELGFGDETLSSIKSLIKKPHGIILVTGPTGSGKTTTLYAALSYINDVTRNILTVEDPIEYYLPGIGQTQVNNKVEMTFARGLRAILRQDPDVVMVGEIRDLETAEIAVQASLTGHLVLSTLHTNSAIGAVTRLNDMGVQTFLLATSLIGVAAQRLVRVLCRHCKQPKVADHLELELMNCKPDEKITYYLPKGCALCQQSGYQGRIGIYEVVCLDEHLCKMIHDKASEQDMEKYARKKSLSMRQDGFRRVLLGDTSLEEVLRVTSDHS